MDYTEVKLDTEIAATVNLFRTPTQIVGRVVQRVGNVVYVKTRDSGTYALDLDTVADWHILPTEPANIWLTANPNGGTTTIHTQHGSLTLTPEQFTALRNLV